MPRPQQVFLFLLLIYLIYSVYRDIRIEETWTATLLPKQLPKSASLRPLVFGILTQPFYDDERNLRIPNGYSLDQDHRDYNETYVAASYVKWLEDGGAMSIPIPFDASPSLVEDILGQVDGVLFPGGASPLPLSAITIWELLHSEKYYYPVGGNEFGDRIPLWGTCLGMEFIVQLAASTNETECNCNYNRDILEKGYNSTNISLPLLDVHRTGLYRPKRVYDVVTGYNVTMNNHHLGVSPTRFRKNPGLSQRFDITSINVDRNGKAFVSTIEPKLRPRRKKGIPVYGVQYHPEKNAHEYGLYPHTTIPYEAIDHASEGIFLSLYEANFLVNLARENVLTRRQTTSVNKYSKPDLYPMIHTYPRRVGYKFQEQYIIPPANQWECIINSKNSNDSVYDKAVRC